MDVEGEWERAVSCEEIFNAPNANNRTTEIPVVATPESSGINISFIFFLEYLLTTSISLFEIYAP